MGTPVCACSCVVVHCAQHSRAQSTAWASIVDTSVQYAHYFRGFEIGSVCLPVKRRSARLRSRCFKRIGFKQTLRARTEERLVRRGWPQEDRRSHVLGTAGRARAWRDQAHLRSRGRPRTASEARTGRACQPRRHQSTLHQLGWVRATRTRMHTTAGEDSRRRTRMGPLARVRFC